MLISCENSRYPKYICKYTHQYKTLLSVSFTWVSVSVCWTRAQLPSRIPSPQSARQQLLGLMELRLSIYYVAHIALAPVTVLPQSCTNRGLQICITTTILKYMIWFISLPFHERIYKIFLVLLWHIYSLLTFQIFFLNKYSNMNFINATGNAELKSNKTKLRVCSN